MEGDNEVTKSLRVGLIGDYDPAVAAHRAIPIALKLAGDVLKVDVLCVWHPTEQIRNQSIFCAMDGLWCVPASPYKSMEGALLAIRFAREQGLPFLGTCGGFQHAVIEYARNVLGWADAEHAETSPEAERAVIAPLSCALVETSNVVRFRPSSRIAAIYGCKEATEGYRCSFGLNAEFEAELLSKSLRPVAHDAAGAVRAVELADHPFFIATLFQPERAALQGQLPPLAKAFVLASAAHAAQHPDVFDSDLR
jgi:CTP synthase (UTP-ammonia lyase)